jgi:hypothetical protein
VKSSQADFLYTSVLLVPIRSERTARGSRYVAAERTCSYNKYISRDRYPASLLARRSDPQKTKLPILLRVGPCLQSCCLATRCSNPLHYVIMAHWPISNAHFINLSHYVVHAYMRIPLSLLGNGSINTFPRQRIYATIEEFLDASFPIRSASNQMIVCGSAYVSPILVHVPSKLWSEDFQSRHTTSHQQLTGLDWIGFIFSLLCF